MSSPPTDLFDRLRQRTATVGVLGLGYVGLPLAVELARAGFRTLGIEVDKERVRALHAGRSYIPDVSDDRPEVRCES